MRDKRKKHAAGFKAKVAFDALLKQETVQELSVRYGIHSTQVNLWKAQLREAAIGVFEHPSVRRGAETLKDSELYEQVRLRQSWRQDCCRQTGEAVRHVICDPFLP